MTPIEFASVLRGYAGRVGSFRFRDAEQLVIFMDDLRKAMLTEANELSARQPDPRPAIKPGRSGVLTVDRRSVRVEVRRRFAVR